MAKANIDLPNGTKIIVDGSPEEITSILESLSDQSLQAKGDPGRRIAPAEIPKRKEKIGLTGLVLELKTQGFFKEKKGYQGNT